jgi:adenosylcobinamide-GDP ribazoletransferase
MLSAASEVISMSSTDSIPSGDGRWATPFWAALQFLTVAPLPARVFTPLEMGRAVGYFPLVGALLGGALALLDRGLGALWPASVASALVLVVWVGLTGALHLDGFLDTCDGLLGGQSPEARLRIMRDERVGAFAVTGGVLLLLVKYAALAALLDRAPALILAPALGRWGMALAIAAFPYARPEGLGRAMKDYAGWRQAALAGGATVALAWIAGGWLGLAAAALASLATYAVARFSLGRLPGLTGDIYGATCEIVETVTLLCFAAKIF